MGLFVLCRLFLLCTLLTKTIVSKAPPNLDITNTGKLNECKRCNILADSFNHWIQTTSRGKYEGGDAAWEESKLKAYGRSEIRLVEIQEGLCSELKRYQDDCYMLAEEVDQVLEKWWFNEGPDSADLYTWLCIQTLQHCCPKDHFGESCFPCLSDKNNKVCSGHGTCYGEGTRKGNGTCLCLKGYDGKICDECAKNYFRTNSNSCEPCHKACDQCSGEGITNCHSCKSGWQLESGRCKDINECLDSSMCKSDQFCINKEGSYNCKPCHISCKTCAGGKNSDCTSCEPSLILLKGRCLDEEHKSDVIRFTIKKLLLYLGLFTITYFILRHYSKSFSSLLALIIAVYMFFLERSCEFSSWDVYLNLFSFSVSN